MADVTAEHVSSGLQPEKRKRGRPRKLESKQPEGPKPKRGRGRPKGSKNKKPSKRRFRRVKYNTKKCQNKQSKRINKNVRVKPTEAQGLQSNMLNSSKINGKRYNKSKVLKNIKNSATSQNLIQCKTGQNIVALKERKLGKAKLLENIKDQILKKRGSARNQCKSTQPSNDNHSHKSSVPSSHSHHPFSYRRKSCGLCDQTSITQHNVSLKHSCKNRKPNKKKQSLPVQRRSLRIKSIYDQSLNSTSNYQNYSPNSASSPDKSLPLLKPQKTRTVPLSHSQPHCNSQHSSLCLRSKATVNNIACLSSNTSTNSTTTTSNSSATSAHTTTSSTPAHTSGVSIPVHASPPPLTSAALSLSLVSSASPNDSHHPTSFSLCSIPKDSPCDAQTECFSPTSQAKDITEAVSRIKPLPSNSCNMKMLQCHRPHHHHHHCTKMSPSDITATNVVRYCSTAKRLRGQCHSIPMNTQPCLSNIRSSTSVATSVISSRISDNNVNIYNHAVEKQQGNVCQTYEQFNIVLSPFEKQIFELHQLEVKQRMAIEREMHQMKMQVMRLKKEALERKLKGKN
ncbi:probable serine/threonine-protein kinase dyrk2 [Argonauta hians]